VKAAETASAPANRAGSAVVLIACENIACRILLEQRRGRPAQLNS